MTDNELLKDRYGLDAKDYCSHERYLKDKVDIIRKNNLEMVKSDYSGYGIYDIYSYQGNCKFDVVILSGLDDGFPQVFVNHAKKEVSPVHGYAGRGKKLADKLGYTYRDI